MRVPSLTLNLSFSLFHLHIHYTPIPCKTDSHVHEENLSKSFDFALKSIRTLFGLNNKIALHAITSSPRFSKKTSKKKISRNVLSFLERLAFCLFINSLNRGYWTSLIQRWRISFNSAISHLFCGLMVNSLLFQKLLSMWKWYSSTSYIIIVPYRLECPIRNDNNPEY